MQLCLAGLKDVDRSRVFIHFYSFLLLLLLFLLLLLLLFLLHHFHLFISRLTFSCSSSSTFSSFRFSSFTSSSSSFTSYSSFSSSSYFTSFSTFTTSFSSAFSSPTLPQICFPYFFIILVFLSFFFFLFIFVFLSSTFFFLYLFLHPCFLPPHSPFPRFILPLNFYFSSFALSCTFYSYLFPLLFHCLSTNIVKSFSAPFSRYLNKSIIIPADTSSMAKFLVSPCYSKMSSNVAYLMIFSANQTMPQVSAHPLPPVEKTRSGMCVLAVQWAPKGMAFPWITHHKLTYLEDSCLSTSILFQLSSSFIFF